uniref:Uncharacterized protein n=1 Tax=Populus alba TaxID=43335 RepID=A0A4U5R0E5_POPAL|nr:hypothetical protein D5086_0000039090 [Populus alba]
MEWFYPKRRGPEWKQGWTGQTVASMSPPPFPLLAIFCIVISLLWLSHYSGYKAQFAPLCSQPPNIPFLAAILLILFMASSSTDWTASIIDSEIRRMIQLHVPRAPSLGGIVFSWCCF